MAEKLKNSFTLDKNSFVDSGEGVIRFSNGLVITDDSVMKSGHSYDIASMSLSDWNGLITLDHDGTIESIVGKAQGLRKDNNRVLIDGVRLAISENPKALFLYNLLKGGFLPDVSVETYDGSVDEGGRRHGAKLVGLSFVVIGNNDNAALIKNSLEKAEQSILGTDKPEEKEETIMAEETKVVDAPEAEKAPETQDNSAILSAINSLGDALKGITGKVESLEKNAFNKEAKEPEFKAADKNSASAPTILTNKFAGLDYKAIHGKQINAAWALYKDKNPEAHKELMDLNKFNLEQLQKKSIVTNSMTIDSMGDFVISPELYGEVIGHRSNFRPLLDLVSFRDTLSLQFAALKRNGDISMEEVDMCEDPADSSGNIKPVSEYTAEPIVDNLHEVAAVTPVCTAATRFLAVDLLGDIAQGYRVDYDRKLAQLVVARLQQAVNATGNSVIYDQTTDTASLQSLMNLLCAMQENVMDGVIILNQCSYSEILKAAVGAGIAGPLSSVFTAGEIQTIAGIRFAVVPNELLPSLGTNETRTFTVGGQSVVINQAMFYFNPSTFTGRTSGGLNYRFADQASYTTPSGATRHAFQRDELLIRGYFFRGGLVLDDSEVVGVGTTIIS